MIAVDDQDNGNDQDEASAVDATNIDQAADPKAENVLPVLPDEEPQVLPDEEPLHNG